LKGKIYKRKFLDPNRLHGLGYFSAFGLGYWYHSALVMQFGSSLTTLGLTAAAVMGMRNLAPTSSVNTIQFVKGGENEGKLLINISTGLFASQNIIAEVKNIHGMCSLSNDDIGE